MADYDEELSEIESEVDRLTRRVSGYERVGQSTPKYMIIKKSNKKRIYNLNNLFTLLESRNAVTNFVTGRVSIENDMLCKLR
jgi:hypothetical protein